MGKNIVVCCDGTANEIAKDWTNVVKLHMTLEKHPDRQIIYYHPGVGTMAPSGVMTTVGRWYATLGGLAFGAGLRDDVGHAYTFIANHYTHGDRLFLFGFSRGAYTARVVAAMLHMYGVIGKGNDPLVPYMTRMLWSINRLRMQGVADSNPRIAEWFRKANLFKETFAETTCEPHFIGVWDTVSSVGCFANPLRLPFTRNNPSITIGRHAIAIDERRAFYRTNRWAPDPPTNGSGPRNVKQVWFAGVHCDVGGGYEEAESGLSKIPLQWMLDEATQAGLMVDPSRRNLVLGEAGGHFVKPDANACLHQSLTPLWRAAEYVPKRHWNDQLARPEWKMNRSSPRSMGERPLVHHSVWDRNNSYSSRIPADAIQV